MPIILINKKDWSASKMTEIKAELSKRGLSIKGRKKAELALRLTTAISDERFEKFPLLCPEIREMIWKEALPGRPIILISGWHFCFSVCSCGPERAAMAMAPLIVTSKEAFTVVFNRLHQAPGHIPPEPQFGKLEIPGYSYSYHLDVFYFDDIRHNLTGLDGHCVKRILDIDTEKIECIAVNQERFGYTSKGIPTGEEDNYEDLFPLLAALKNLKEVICLLDKRPVDEKGWRPLARMNLSFGTVDDWGVVNTAPPVYIPDCTDMPEDVERWGHLKDIFKGAGDKNEDWKRLESIKICFASFA